MNGLIVSDATPINVLIRVGREDVLVRLFERVLIPPAVFQELTHASTPDEVASLIRIPPAWLESRVPRAIDAGPEQGRGSGRPSRWPERSAQSSCSSTTSEAGARRRRRDCRSPAHSGCS